MRILLAILLALIILPTIAQKKIATVSGYIIDESGKKIPNTSVVILGKTIGVNSTDSGYFTIQVPAEKSFALLFSHTGYYTIQKNFFLSNNETEFITVQLINNSKELATVIISDKRERIETGLTKINPQLLVVLKV
jgi:hypothetical protein